MVALAVLIWLLVAVGVFVLPVISLCRISGIRKDLRRLRDELARMHSMPKVSLIAFVLLSVTGCATSQMKSTPFYSGSERVYTGRVEDRVNLWPIGYYREPALSVLWPIYSQTDDHLAVRPVYSQYKQGGKDAGYDEFNFIWPFCQFDTKHDEHRIFPLFWGDGHVDFFPLVWWQFDQSFTLFPLVWWQFDQSFTLFPLAWWQFDHSFTLFPLAWWKKDQYFNVFPLWWSGSNRKLLIPFYYQDDNSIQVIPFYGSTRNVDRYSQWIGPYRRYRNERRPEANYDWCLPFYYRDAASFETMLFGWNRNDRSSWAFPFYYKDDNDFVSLPWISGRNSSGNDEWIAPLLLSGGESGNTGSLNAYLLGFGGCATKSDGKSSQWVFPLFYHDDDSLLTPFYGRTGDDNFYSPLWISWNDEAKKESGWCAPPLLSWGTSGGGEWAQRYLFGLYGREGKDDETSSWLFPLYYSDKDQFVTPLCYSNKDQFVTPLCYSNKDRFVTPLYGQTDKSNWCVPLWYKDDKGLLTLPYCSWWNEKGEREGSFVLPALTYFGADGNFASLLWGKVERENWLLPLWWKDEWKFVSLLWAWNWSNKCDTYVVPPLLSWIKSSELGSRKMRFLLGLGGVDTKENGDVDCSWVLPLYRSDDRVFISLLFGHENNDFTFVTPFAGILHQEHRKGAWLWPLCGWTNDIDMEKAEAMLNAPTLDPKIRVEKHEKVYSKGRTNRWYEVTGGIRANDSSWRLSGLGTSGHWISWHVSNDGKTVTGKETSDFGNILAYKSKYIRKVKFDDATKKKISDEENGEAGLLCNFLWHSKHEVDKEREYDMRSILWRFWHYEKLNGDVTVDAFPSFTYDSKTSGYSKTSLLWRLFRNEYDPKTDKRSVDFLFIPVWR